MARYAIGGVGETFTAKLGTHTQSEYGEEESSEESTCKDVSEKAGGGCSMDGEER